MDGCTIGDESAPAGQIIDNKCGVRAARAHLYDRDAGGGIAMKLRCRAG